MLTLFASILFFQISHAAFISNGSSLQMVIIKCNVDSEFIYLDVQYMLTGKYNKTDVYLRHKTNTEKKWTIFRDCKNKRSLLMSSIRCKTMNIFDFHSYNIELVHPNVSSVYVLGPFTPLFYKRQCTGNPPAMVIQKIDANETMIKLAGNLSREAVVIVYETWLKVTDGKKFNQKYPCKSNTLLTRTCTATDLRPCTAYKLCIEMSILDLRHKTVCTNTTTEVTKPQGLSYQAKRKSNWLIFSWKAMPLASKKDYFQFTYVNKRNKKIHSKTLENSVKIEGLGNTTFSVKRCTCMCSKEAIILVHSNMKLKAFEKISKKGNGWAIALSLVLACLATTIVAVFVWKKMVRKRYPSTIHLFSTLERTDSVIENERIISEGYQT